jgi:hypothetical protein
VIRLRISRSEAALLVVRKASQASVVCSGKHATFDDEIASRLKLEEKQLTRLQCIEAS